jgi:hypothetical protein
MATNGEVDLEDLEPDVEGGGGSKRPKKMNEAACIENLIEEDRCVPMKQVFVHMCRHGNIYTHTEILVYLFVWDWICTHRYM